MEDCNPVKTFLSSEINQSSGINLSGLVLMLFKQSEMKSVPYLLTMGSS